MLSYRHGYHAGNHADMLKHMVLCLILRSLNQKEKPYTLIDTHAGAGIYDLRSTFAQKNHEYETGLSRIIRNKKLHELVPEFFTSLNKVNGLIKEAPRKKIVHEDGSISFEVEPNWKPVEVAPDAIADKLEANARTLYPGSPFFECSLSRRNDTLFFSDLHKAEFESLREIYKRTHKVHIDMCNGLDHLKALLPPARKRGLVLIDPSYEMKNEYYEVVKALKEATHRWPQGIFAIWYPVLARMHDQSKRLTQDIKRLNMPLLQAEIQISAQDEDFGMCGSGMLVVNYPYRLDTMLEPIMNELYSELCDPKSGKAKLEVLNPQP